MRKAPSIVLSTAVVLTALTSCAQAPGSGCEPTVHPGNASDLISVGPAGDSSAVGAPEVTFPTPLDTSSTQATTITSGTGEAVTEGTPVTLKWSIYNGRTGALLHSNGFDGAPNSPVLPSGLPKGMADALVCATEGSRVAVAVSPEDGFGEAGNPDFGVRPGDSLVVVADVEQAFLARANGTPQPVVEPGFPSVVSGSDGTPGFTIPSSDAPTDLKIATLQKGDGRTVAKGDVVMVNYTGVLWDSKTVFDSSWEKGQPALFRTDQVVEGFQKALEGATVGSRVLAVIPPKFGYGDQASESVPANSTLVFAVDILGVIDQ